MELNKGTKENTKEYQVFIYMNLHKQSIHTEFISNKMKEKWKRKVFFNSFTSSQGLILKCLRG